MKIAVVVPPWFRVPPEKYGGIEAIVGLLVEGLVKKGHIVTLFSIGVSKTNAELFKVFDEEMRRYLDKEPSSFLNTALTHSTAAYLEIAHKDYDIIHDHTWKEGIVCALFLGIPVVHTLHGPFNEENKRFYSLFKKHKGIHFVTISNFQQHRFPELPYIGTVYNAIDLSKYPFSEEKKDFFFYMGRFNAEKAPHLACKAAKALGKKLYLAGKLNEEAERRYFENYIKPHLDENIVYLGEISEAKKMELFSQAKCYLFPIQWDEPFGITMVEAMACGTPVVTFDRGSAKEVVADGETGFVVNTMQEFLDAIGRADEIEPQSCRRRVEKMFSAEVMVENYERLYKKVIDHWRKKE